MENHEINIAGSEDLRERLELCIGRVAEIAACPASEVADMEACFAAYFQKVAAFIMSAMSIMDLVEGGLYDSLSAEKKAEINRAYYEDILPENYGTSYACPSFAVRVLGEEYGQILSFVYTELRSMMGHIMRRNAEPVLVMMELFLELHYLLQDHPASPRQLREVIYDYVYDYADLWMNLRVRQLLDPALDHAAKIIRNSNPSDISYLYDYGEYVSDREIRTASFVGSLPEEMICQMADTFVEGYVKGFAAKGSDLSKKTTVDLRYNLGFERVMKKAIVMFEDLGLKPVIYPVSTNTLTKKRGYQPGYLSTEPNEQYVYDHRLDEGLYLDRHLVDRKLACMRSAYEKYKELAAGYAGPAVFEVFGEEPFSPVLDQAAVALSEKQRELVLRYSSGSGEITNEYINQEERSFTIISYPTPGIGAQYEEIFHEIHRVNTLDTQVYQKIQQTLIDALDACDHVRILGRDGNETDMTIALCPLEDPERQTRFENCLADVNIPLGEVFTTPQLEGTEGLLHLKSVFLNGLDYIDLKLSFEEGKVSAYSCGNFIGDPDMDVSQAMAAGKTFVQENLLENHETLPVGEFAIGTNTLASSLMDRYGIHKKMNILIAEKTGPHLALGDTCYSFEEEVKTYNPDGKEIVAKENSCSRLRDVDMEKAYFRVHTDITIPYAELGCIKCIMADGSEVFLIRDGRFVLPGTELLNEALDE